MNTGLTIGKVAKRAGVNIQTIRFYERKGILKPIERKASGYRVYDEEASEKIIFIKNAQDLGFSLREISILLDLKLSTTARAPQVRKKVQDKLGDVEEKIEKLESIRRVLKGLVKSCHTNKTTDHCPILKSLEKRK